MVLGYFEIVLQLVSLGLVIGAAALWAGAGIDTRPKFRDEQTLVGGTIWSQIIIPIGLMISKIVEEPVDPFIQGFYLLVGVSLLWATSIVLVVHEVRTQRRRSTQYAHHQSAHRIQSLANMASRANISALNMEAYDKVYSAIGIVCFIAGTVKMVELILYVFM